MNKNPLKSRALSLLASVFAATSPSFAQPIITEIADPDNSAGARFVEIYNPTGTPIDLSLYELIRWTNNNSSPQSPVSLSGTLAPGSFALFVANSTTFNNTYVGVTAPVVELGVGGPVDSNGDDNIAIRLSSGSAVIDIFGVPGEDGSGTAHEFEDGRAERAASSTTPSSVWIAGDWNVDNDSGGGDGAIDAPGGFDPGAWIGEITGGPSITITSTATSIDEGTTDPDLIQVSLLDASSLTFPLNVTLSAVPTGEVNLDGTVDSTTLNFTADSDTFDVSVEAINDSNYGSTVQMFVTATGTGLTTGSTSFDLIDDEILASGDIVITEIMQNPSPASDTNYEWFEVYNAASGSIDLNGWTISDAGSDSHTISNGGPLFISPGAYFVFARNADQISNGGVVADYAYTGITLANGDDEIILTSSSALEIDRVEWDGGPAFPDPDGASMALISPALDNNVGSNWVTASTPYGDGDFGTPGSANPAPASLMVSIDNTSFSEAAGFSAATLTVTRPDASGELTVTVTTNDASEAVPVAFEIVLLDTEASGSIDIDAINDLWLDGNQTVTLSASAPGFIGASLQVLVQDDADPAGVIINEVYYADTVALQDANQDGTASSEDDEFIEIVNVSGAPFDLSFCSIIENGFDFNTRGAVHVFPEGTVLAPGAAIVVFGGGDLPDGTTAAFGTAEIQKANGVDGDALALSDSGDQVRIRNAFDSELYSVDLPDVSTLGASGSFTLSPDLSAAGGYIPHTTATPGLEFSPGTEIDGTTPFATVAQSLTILVNSPNIPEEAGSVVAAFTVSLPAMATSATEIRLESSDSERLFVPSVVTIPSGTDSVDVEVFPTDDVFETGDSPITVTAILSGYLNDSGVLNIIEDDVTFTDLVINEVDAQTLSTDADEFIELYTTNVTSPALDGLILMLFNGTNDEAYDVIDLASFLMPADGFFVIGSSSVPNVDFVYFSTNGLQNGPDAVALVKGTAANNPVGTPASGITGTLVDAVVHADNGSDDAGLIASLTPGQVMATEAGGAGGNEVDSASRVPDGGPAFDTALYTAQTATPGVTNVLPDNDDFSTWAADQVPPVVDGPDGDPDGDGITNLVEYALGLNPNTSSGSPGTLSNGTLTFTKGADAKANGDLVYEIETSTDLGATDPWSVNGAAVDGTDDITLDLTAAGGVATEFFARLKVTQVVVN